LLLVPALAAPSASVASNLETFVMSVAGNSSWYTYSAPQPVFDYFGSIGVSIPTNPDGLAASGIQGGFRTQTAAVGPLSDADSIASDVFPSTWSLTNTFTGSTAATARYGLIGAEAQGTFDGWGGSSTIAGTEAFAIFQDSMTVTAPSVTDGTAGSIKMYITVDGSMTSTGDAGTGWAQVNYQQNSGGNYLLFRASVDPRGGGFYPFSGPGRDGFSITNTAVSGSGVFDTFSLPITFGTPFDLKVGLLAFVLPGKDNVADVVFSSTARLTGIEVSGPNGAVVDFSIVSGSGTAYGVNGVHLAGDVDADGHVDVVDVLYLVDAFGTVSGDGNYNSACDFNADGAVDVVDLLLLVDNWGT
jgi:hypothetical protein